MWLRVRWMALGGLVTLLIVGAGALAAGRIAPGRLGDFFFGPRLARAEVVLVINGQAHDFRIDRGRLKSAPRGGTIELRELDGTVQVVPVAPGAEVSINRQPAPLGALGRGMIVTAIRDGGGAAQQVIAEGPRVRGLR
jgi:hypothetical protein